MDLLATLRASVPSLSVYEGAVRQVLEVESAAAAFSHIEVPKLDLAVLDIDISAPLRLRTPRIT
jgi:hypothetical protein